MSAELEVESSESENNLQSVSNDKVESTEEGESSLLLSLLPGILQNPKYRNLSARQILTLNLSRAIAQQSMGLSAQNSPTKTNSEHNYNNLIDNNNNDRLGHDFPIEDSGIESGEDLRLLAANIQSNLGNNKMEEINNNINVNSNTEDMQQQISSPEDKTRHVDTLGTDLLSEVTAALEKLQESMNLGEIDLDDSKKTALLSLVNRLQVGLISSDKKAESNIESADSAVSVTSPISPESNDIRRGSGGNINRFNKRKNRASRHTVGVTREELADARRIIEELKFIDVKNVNTAVPAPEVTNAVTNSVPTAFSSSTPTAFSSILTRQISEPVTLMRPSQFVPKDPQTEAGKPKYKLLFKQSISLDQPPTCLKNTVKQEIVTKIDRNLSGGSSNNSVSNKFVNNINSENDAPTDESSSSDDEDEMTNTKYYNGSNNANTQNGKFRAKENFLRNQQQIYQGNNEKSLNYSSGDESRDTSNSARQPKYMSKKMKMKRANTVDIPKSYSFVNTFELMDKDTSDNETTKNTYQNCSPRPHAGLKTTFTGGNAPLPPKFTPKTENDKKFMAFIQKQNANVVPTYVNPTATRNEPKHMNWTNKFGNLKTRFEESGAESPKPIHNKPANAAANFWKNIEKDKPSAKVSPLPAVPIKNSQNFIKNLPVSTEKFPWKNNPANDKVFKAEEQIIAKKMPIIDKFVPKEQPPAPTFKTIPEPNKLPVLKPSTVNNFSHAPMSVFKPPISRKLSNSFKPIQNNEDIVKKTMPQITNGLVKQMAETGYNINDNNPVTPKKLVNSPTRSIASLETSFVKVNKPVEPKTEATPWAQKPKSDRVMNIANSKFENVPTVHLGAHLTEDEPIVRFRSNPLYNGTPEKRQSLPSNAHLQFSAFEPVVKDIKKEQTNSLYMPKDATFVITDFTQPMSVSTYSPPEEVLSLPKPNLSRQDSLTNPSKEPLVLTCDRTVISPREPKPMDFIEQPTSPHISNDHSIGSICDDLDHELDDLGESIECQVAVSKVMKAPIAQTAYTQSSELTSLNSQKKENVMIQSLHDSLKKLQQKSPTPEKKQVDGSKRLSQDSSNSSIDSKILKTPAVHVDTHNESQSRLSQDSSNSSIDLKLPPLKIPIAAVPETAYSIVYKSPPRIQVKSPSTDPPHSHVLYNNISNKGQPTYSLSVPSKAPMVDRSITPPGMYGVPQHVIDTKQKTVASFFTPSRTESLKIKSNNPLSVAPPLQKSSQPATRKISLQVKPMMMTQTTKVSSKDMYRTQQSMNSLSRSKTMPSLAKVELLDESNIDDAFEELLSSSNL